MKGKFIVKKLNKSGNYLSSLDWNPLYKGKDNPDGLFKMVITPIEISEDRMEIRYMKTKDGYLISGEAYIITGPNETEIDQKAKHYKEKYQNVIHTKCKSENEL